MVAESPGHPGNSVDEDGLKRRMLGAAVLIALAVIFLPLVFDGSGTESQFRSIEPLQMEPPYDAVIFDENTMSLPDGTPVIDFIEDDQLTISEIKEVSLQEEKARRLESYRPVAAVAEAVPAARENHLAAKQSQPVPVAQLVEPEKPVKIVQAQPVVSPKAVVDNVSWLIQVASFRDKINALGLRSDLKNDGHPVLVKVGEITGDPVFRVFVGPIQGKNNANDIRARLENRLNRETLLVEAN